MRMIWLLSLLAMSACNGSNDLAPSPSAPDLAPSWVEQGQAVCPGIALPDACASALGSMTYCFTPVGTCLVDNTGSADNLTACWSNGAGMKADPDEITYYGPPRAFCYVAKLSPGQASVLYGVSYDEVGGILRCGDGSFVDVGRAYAGCPSLRALVEPDLSQCASGACPRPR